MSETGVTATLMRPLRVAPPLEVYGTVKPPLPVPEPGVATKLQVFAVRATDVSRDDTPVASPQVTVYVPSEA